MARLAFVLFHLICFWLEFFSNSFWNIHSVYSALLCYERIYCSKVCCKIFLFLQAVNVIPSNYFIFIWISSNKNIAINIIHFYFLPLFFYIQITENKNLKFQKIKNMLEIYAFWIKKYLAKHLRIFKEILLHSFIIYMTVLLWGAW